MICVYLERLKGRKRVALEEMVNDPMILELNNGKVYGGRLDEYYYNGGGVVALYGCKLLDKDRHMWINHDIMMMFEGKLVLDDMPDFWISDVKDIFILPEEYRDECDLEDALQIYIDPYYKHLHGVKCEWGHGRKHSSECDARLHEALSSLLTIAHFDTKSEDNERARADSFAYIRRRLLLYGAKIP